MNKESFSFLKDLMNSWGPAGYEHNIRSIIKSELENSCDRLEIDYHGNIAAYLNEGNRTDESDSSSKKMRIVLAGHIDEVGFQVRYIDDKGFVYIRAIGGVDYSIVQARKVKIHTKNGDVVGVIGRKAFHLIEDKGKAPKEGEIFVDVGANDGDDAKKLIEIGDPVTYDNGMEELRNNIYCSKAFDNRLGAFIITEVMKNVYARKVELKSELICVGTCQEEAHTRGIQSFSHRIGKADVGIAIDGTFSVDTPHANPNKEGMVKLGKGIALARGSNTNPKLFEMMINIMKSKNLQYQIEAEPVGNGTDADPMQRILGCATGLVSVPLRYMHTQYEVICLNDVEDAIAMLTELCININENVDLIP